MKQQRFRLDIGRTGDGPMRTVKLVQSLSPWKFSGQSSEKPGPEFSVDSGLQTSQGPLEPERVNNSMTVGL